VTGTQQPWPSTRRGPFVHPSRILGKTGFGATSGKHEGRLWASLGSLERPKDFKDTETIHLSGEGYIFFQRHGHL
jgi:hypothetical protein